MSKEFETHILNIDKAALASKLEALGAKKIKDVLQKRITFDYPDRHLDADRAFIRVRDNGEGRVELAFKRHKRSGENGVADCEEIEFAVSDMELARQFFLAIGLEMKQLIETKRLEYSLEDLTFDIDEWPMIPPFLEIEGPSQERVMEGARLLGYSDEETYQGHAGDIYELKGIDWKAMKEIRF